MKPLPVVAIFTFPIDDNGAALLTASEREVAAAILEGKSNAAIAKQRKSAVRTVANQVASIFRKLGVHSRGELAASEALVWSEPAEEAPRSTRRLKRRGK
jgi:DNA-binding NarL/FixJ family response regulator